MFSYASTANSLNTTICTMGQAWTPFRQSFAIHSPILNRVCVFQIHYPRALRPAIPVSPASVSSFRSHAHRQGIFPRKCRISSIYATFRITDILIHYIFYSIAMQNAMLFAFFYLFPMIITMAVFQTNFKLEIQVLSCSMISKLSIQLTKRVLHEETAMRRRTENTISLGGRYESQHVVDEIQRHNQIWLYIRQAVCRHAQEIGWKECGAFRKVIGFRISEKRDFAAYVDNAMAVRWNRNAGKITHMPILQKDDPKAYRAAYPSGWFRPIIIISTPLCRKISTLYLGIFLSRKNVAHA